MKNCPESKPLEFHDIQGIILSGYGYLPLARYVFLRWGEDKTQARSWLHSLVPDVTTAGQVIPSQGHYKRSKEDRPHQAVHVALTATGLRELGLPEQGLKTFLREFREGMVSEHRQRVLGDTGGSAPKTWQFGGPDTEDIHLVLMLFAEAGEHALGEGQWSKLEQLYQQHRRRYEAAGLKEVFPQDSRLLVEGQSGFHEPFGFRDGLSSPAIEGAPRTRADYEGEPTPAGEFILGYKNASGSLPLSPRVPGSLDTEGLLKAASEDGAWKDLGRNGSYMVLRKLKQDVQGFRHFIQEHSQKDPADSSQQEELLAAKLMGRWKSGAPLSLCPVKDDPSLGADPQRNNAFSYADDPHGMKCPVTAHVRRANPRAITKKGKKRASHHQIIRRGRPYAEPQRGEEGLVFIAINSHFRRQFEFIQQTWLNNRKFGGLRDERDPIVGNNQDPEVQETPPSSYEVTIPALPVRQRIQGLPRFVHVRGGGYFFLPGIQALKFLGTLPV